MAARRALERRTHGGARGLCPKSVIVVAGDNFADALAATSLSDPTDKGAGPLLERVAAADPLFDPIGGFARPDMAVAPIIVTASGRQGASTLSISSRIAATDMAQGGCTTARSAVIVGGAGAVARSVETDLLSLGYTQVFRVAGVDRFDTAARVAQALGTKPVPDGTTSCLDSDVTDSSARMTFYAPSVVELRDGSTSCRLLGRTVVLADGGTGADALAAGWWTSFWQVPVLLTAPDGSLPAGTRAALQATAINNVIVLGGTARIPDSTLNEAQSLTGAAIVRIAGDDRYATSVEMAKRLGGWWPTGDPADSAGSMACLAASGGQGSNSVGWPDALGAGPFCGAINGGATNPGPPARLLPPVAGSAPTLALATRPARDAVPILLTAPQATALPPSVVSFLAAVFPTSNWCSSAAVLPSCAMPGFVIAFGGHTVLADDALLDASTLVTGSTYQVTDDLTPTVADGFTTGLEMAPVFAVGGSPAGTMRQCYERSARCSVCGGSRCTATARQRNSTPSSTSPPRADTSATRTACRAHPARARPCASRSWAARNGSRSWEASACRVARRRAPHCRTARSQRMSLSANVDQANPTGSGAASESMVPAVGTTWTFAARRSLPCRRRSRPRRRRRSPARPSA